MQVSADIIIKNGNCITMENEREIFDWIAIKNDKILALGYKENYKSFVGTSTIILDAKKKTVLPSFIDSHFHLVQTALNEESVNLFSINSFEEIGKKIKRMEKKNPGECIFGVRLQKENLPENKFPNRQILDKFSNNVPIWLNSLDYQVSMLNTYGLLYYKIPFRIEGVEVDENGVPTGIFRGKANAILRTNILNNYPNKKRENNIRDLMPKLLSVGITTINAMEGGYMYSDKDAEIVYEHKDNFPVDIVLFFQCLDLETIKDKKLDRIGGSLYIDGTMGARTAALTFEYVDCPGEMGRLIFSQDELNKFVEECYTNRLQLSLYTIGDRAIEMALNAHEYAFFRTGIKGLRHRLEHVELASIEHIKRAKELEIIFSMNPTYETYWGGSNKMYYQRLGEKYRETNKFREIIDGGVILCGGSDSDICDYNPLIGIHAAVNHPVKEHRVTLYEAIKMYTINAAYAIFEEEKKGTLRTDKIADIIILDRDIFRINMGNINNVKVQCTIKSGKILYNKIKVTDYA